MRLSSKEIDELAAKHGAVKSGKFYPDTKNGKPVGSPMFAHYFNEDKKEVFLYAYGFSDLAGYEGTVHDERIWGHEMLARLHDWEELPAELIKQHRYETVYSQAVKYAADFNYTEMDEIIDKLKTPGQLKHELWWQTKVRGESPGGAICSALQDRISQMDKEGFVEKFALSVSVGTTFQKDGMEYSVHALPENLYAGEEKFICKALREDHPWNQHEVDIFEISKLIRQNAQAITSSADMTEGETALEQSDTPSLKQ